MLVKALEKLFNISPPEFSRTSYAWLLKFLLKLGSIIGTTMVVSIFVTRYSIGALPFVFLIQALFTIGGMFLSSIIIHRFQLRYLIVFHLIAGAIVLFLASFAGDNMFLFLASMIFVGGVTIPQSQILLSNYIEDFFTPGEAVRIFPVIESAEVIAGIGAGFLVSQVFPMDLGVRFVYVWAALLLVLSLVIFFFQPHSPKFLHYLFEITHQKKRTKTKNIFTDGFKEILRIPFLKILFVAMFCYWLLFQFIEFQFTKVVHDSLEHGNVEGEMAQSLGSLHLFFYSLALVMQLMLAGRIMKYLGTAGGFLFHALVSLMGVIGLVFGFGHFATMLVKNNYEMSGVVFKSSYENSYYAFKHGTQRFYRELFEGAVAPAATVFATAVLSLLNWFFIDEHLPIVTNLLLVFATFGLVVLAAMMKEPYTNMVKQHLFHPVKHSPQGHILEILAEQGHKNNVDDLMNFYKLCGKKYKSHVLQLLTQKPDTKVVNFLLMILHHSAEKDVIDVLQALEHNVLLKQSYAGSPYLKQKVIKTLHLFFEKQTSELVQVGVLRALYNIDSGAPAFFVHVIAKDVSPKVLSECLHLISLSRDEEKYFFIQKYLRHDNPLVRAEAVRTLMLSPKFKKDAQLIFESFLKSSTDEEKLAFVEKLYKIQSEKSYMALMGWVHDQNQLVRCSVMAAVLKQHHYHIAQTFAHELLQASDEVLEHIEKLLRDGSQHLKSVIGQALLQQSALHGINVQKKDLESVLSHLTPDKLSRLYKAYKACGCTDESQYVEDILETLFAEQNPISSYILAEKAL
ncbi:MFS transporter [Candidatus Peregrinibacteria bacterium]|nr:MFS transporter [Candidatus Peregrinibacteria bacterium]